MKCDVIKDLLVLYAEDMCSDETKVMVEEHLENCEKCKKQLENYKKKLEVEKKADTEPQKENELKPMKKVKKKLFWGRAKIAILSVFIAIIFIIIGGLFYGQMSNNWLSFSAISDSIKIKHACQELVDGNTEPFMDVLAHRMDDRYVIKGADEFENIEAYWACIEEEVKASAEYYFSNRDITVKIIEVYQYPYAEMEAADEDMMDIGIGFYEGNNLIYDMFFVKVSPQKFLVYEYPGNGKPGFVTRMLPYYDINLDVCLQYVTKTNYNQLMDGTYGTIGAGLLLCITTEGTEEEQEIYKENMRGSIEELWEEGWCFKEIMYAKDTYDKESDKWVYKVWFMMENVNDKEVLMMEQSFYYYQNDLYPIDKRPAELISEGSEITKETEEKILGLFK